jgi:hypothetical protein
MAIVVIAPPLQIVCVLGVTLAVDKPLTVTAVVAVEVQLPIPVTVIV